MLMKNFRRNFSAVDVHFAGAKCIRHRPRGDAERAQASSTPKTIVFDLDGVVYRGAAGIPGVAAEITRLQKKVRVLFLTNNATKSRQDYVSLLLHLGIKAKEDEIMTSSFGVAKYIAENFGKKRKVFAIGEQGLFVELEQEAGAEFAGKNAEIVVVGLDRKFDYGKLDKALRNMLGGAKFILANSDSTYPLENRLAPGTGAIGAAISYACGKAPDIVIGKPSTYLIEKLLAMHAALADESVFVGDRLEIDMRMANKAGMKSILVLTGVSKKEEVASAPASDKPGIVLASAAEVGKALGI